MPFSPSTVTVTEIAGRPGHWRLDGALVYTRGDERYEVPERPPFDTDFASVPQVLTWLIPRDGDYTKAAIVHDRLCTTLPDRFAADVVFRDAMHELGVLWLKRWLMWAAVTWATVVAQFYAWWPNARRRVETVAGGLIALALAALVVWAGEGWSVWWRWPLALAVIAGGILLTCAVVVRRTDVLRVQRLPSCWLLTVLGSPFLALGVVCYFALRLYGFVESWFPRRAPRPASDPGAPTRHDERLAHARASAGALPSS